MDNLFIQTAKFLEGVREEVKAVSWPTRSEIIGSVVVVFVGVVLMGSYIGVCDFLLSTAAQVLLR